MDVQTLARPEAKDGQGGSITLPGAGMTCASCVGSVEKAVGKVPGVRTVSVNLATGRAEIEFENAVDVAGVVGAIERAGYEVPENQVELAVEG
ncbi:MAG TPA: heavy metal translocating P-type ATPase, partial [Erythrobacter sp.]|nr:heavy metal translocating P-type ATPase [Erythrobacter sp.]